MHALRGAGLEPGWLIGATIGGGLPNGHWSEGEWLVVEADESDRSLLELEVELALLTNVELDHHTSFASLQDLREVFRRFLEGAATAVVWDRPELLALRGEGPVVPYDAREVVLVPGGSRFRWREHDVHLAVPGVHNALDATGALELVRLTGAEEARRGRRAGRLPRRRTSLSAARARAPAGRSCTTTTPTTRARSRPRCRARARSSTAAWWRSSSPTSTRARGRSPGSSGARWRRPTWSPCSTSTRPVSAPRTSPASAGCWSPRRRPTPPPAGPCTGCPTGTRRSSVLAGVLREGDVCVVMGAGDSDRLAARLAGR